MLLDGFVKSKIDGFEKRLDRIIELLELLAGIGLADQGLEPREIAEMVAPTIKPKRRR